MINKVFATCFENIALSWNELKAQVNILLFISWERAKSSHIRRILKFGKDKAYKPIIATKFHLAFTSSVQYLP